MGQNRPMAIQARLIRLFASQSAGRASLAANLALGLLFLAQARLFAFLTNALYINKIHLAQLIHWFGAAAAVVLLRALVSWLAARLAASAAAAIKTGLRQRLVQKSLHDNWQERQAIPPGLVGQLAGEGVEQLDAYFSQYLPTVFLALFFPLLCVGFVLPLDWLSGLIFLATAPLIPVFMVLIAQGAERATREQWLGLQRMSAYFKDSFQGLLELRRLGRDRQRLERSEALEGDYRRDTLAVLRLTFLSAFALEFLATISTALIAVQIGIRLLRGGIGFEAGFFILLLAPDFYTALRNVGLRYHASAPGLEAAAQIFSLCASDDSAQKERTAVVGSGALTPPQIVFEQVRARYDQGERNVLIGLDFVLPAGKITALAGPNGSGKSTAAALLMGLLPPESGRILIGGKALSQLALSDWQAKIGWLPHLPVVFRASLWENLSSGGELAVEQSVWDVLEQVGLDRLVHSWPGGLNELLGEGRRSLSAGERQRLGLARLLLRQDALLILDEPTAHLDAPGEEEFQRLLTRLAHGKTVLLIAHRAATLKLADQAITLGENREEEPG